jgi:hypothetical protein
MDRLLLFASLTGRVEIPSPKRACPLPGYKHGRPADPDSPQRLNKTRLQMTIDSRKPRHSRIDIAQACTDRSAQ